MLFILCFTCFCLLASYCFVVLVHIFVYLCLLFPKALRSILTEKNGAKGASTVKLSKLHHRVTSEVTRASYMRKIHQRVAERVALAS